MARQISARLDQTDKPDITWRGSLGIEERETMIREAAYQRFVQRGFAHGHDLDDWIAAEVEIDFGTPEPEQAASLEFEVQQSSVHGAAKDDEMKRIIRQHPHKGIPQIESVEPQDAPPKE